MITYGGDIPYDSTYIVMGNFYHSHSVMNNIALVKVPIPYKCGRAFRIELRTTPVKIGDMVSVVRHGKGTSRSMHKVVAKDNCNSILDFKLHQHQYICIDTKDYGTGELAKYLIGDAVTFRRKLFSTVPHVIYFQS